MKNITIKIKNTTDVPTSRLEATKEGISELGRPKEIIQDPGQKDKEIQSMSERFRDRENKARRSKIFLTRVPKGDKREMRGGNTYFKGQ